MSDTQHILVDLEYDDQKLYDFGKRRNQIVYPIRMYRRIKGERRKMITFYKSKLGRRIYGNRSTSVEPLFQCVKDAFGISITPLRGFEMSDRMF
jgi:hypothetical protein